MLQRAGGGRTEMRFNVTRCFSVTVLFLRNKWMRFSLLIAYFQCGTSNWMFVIVWCCIHALGVRISSRRLAISTRITRKMSTFLRYSLQTHTFETLLLCAKAYVYLKRVLGGAVFYLWKFKIKDVKVAISLYIGRNKDNMKFRFRRSTYT